jgi:hypothetical protein
MGGVCARVVMLEEWVTTRWYLGELDELVSIPMDGGAIVTLAGCLHSYSL